jgi:hypothetical protein
MYIRARLFKREVHCNDEQLEFVHLQLVVKRKDRPVEDRYKNC